MDNDVKHEISDYAEIDLKDRKGNRMTDIRIHKYGRGVQADVIAECYDVSQAAYKELWNKCVPLYDDKDRGECPGEITYGLGRYGWRLLSDEVKRELNEKFKVKQKELDTWMEKWK